MCLLLVLTMICFLSSSEALSVPSDLMQVRKVIEHVYKFLRQGNENGHPSANHEKEVQDFSSIAGEKVELLCNNQVQCRHQTLPIAFYKRTYKITTKFINKLSNVLIENHKKRKSKNEYFGLVNC